MKWNLLRAWQRSTAGFLESLAGINGHVVTGLPSTADLLATRVLEARAAGQCRPSVVLLSGEHLEPDTRNRVVDAFGCPVTEMYITSEAGLVGTECPTAGGFHTGPAAWVEIVDLDGNRLAPDEEGEVVLTPLANRAMPLLRYRTGDRGIWLSEPCGCGRKDARFRLRAGRRPSRLVSVSGATMNVVRFAKLIAGLDVKRLTFESEAPGVVRVGYEAGQNLGQGTRAVVAAAVTAALGPQTTVRFELGHLPPTATPIPAGARPELDRPPIHEIAEWLRRELADIPGLRAGVLVGSALDPESTTRFSDLDLVILLESLPATDAWTARGRSLARRLSGLSVIPDAFAGIERRAPLLACRLLAEGFVLIGAIDGLDRPTPDRLQVAARLWLQEATAILWSRLTSSQPDDVQRVAWVATKLAVNALRFDILIRGGTATDARTVVTTSTREFGEQSWFAELKYALAVAREHVPPPLEETGYRYLSAGLACIRAVSDRLGLD